MRIVAINLQARVATLENGVTLPITTMLDYLGDETDDVAECIVFVAGRDDIGWFCERVENFEFHTRH